MLTSRQKLAGRNEVSVQNGPVASEPNEFTSAEIGALAHLYRGEVYRSTLWRTRLDTTTNWSVVTLGIAISVSFSSRDASPVPLILVGFLVLFFLLLEARRYRYFNVWRARARWMETHFYAPMLERADFQTENSWQSTLANDYRHPHYHITYLRAVGRRLRRNFIWILMIQTIAYIGKILVHPTPGGSVAEFIDRASVGPVPGEFVLLGGVLYNGTLIAIAVGTYYLDRVKHHGRRAGSMG